MNFLTEKKVNYYSKLLFILAIILFTLYAGSKIIFPVVLAMFIALSVHKVVLRFDRWGWNRFLSAFLVTFILTVALIALFYFLAIESYYLTQDLNAVSGEGAFALFDSIVEKIARNVGVSLEKNREAFDSVTDTILSSSGQIVRALFKGVRSMALFLSLIPIYIFFMLAYRENVELFLKDTFTKSEQEEGKKIISEIGKMLRRYLVGMVIVMGIVAILNSVGLYFIGIKYAFLLGTGTAIMMVIPYIGVIIGSLIPATIALLTKDSIWYAVGVIALYAFIQFMEGNYITPYVVGTSVNLNPLIIIIGVVVLGAIGGILAMALAVPMIATLKILLIHSDRFSGIARLFEQEKDD